MKKELKPAVALLALMMIATLMVHAQPGISETGKEPGCNKSSLMKNDPDPFSKCTEVHCLLPDTFATAFIKVYSMRGKELQSYIVKTLEDKASLVDPEPPYKFYTCTEGVVTICAGKLTPGNYKYGLVVDGKPGSTLNMVIAKKE